MRLTSSTKDRGFLIRGREIRRDLNALVAELQERTPGRRVSRENVARVLLRQGIVAWTRGRRPRGLD